MVPSSTEVLPVLEEQIDNANIPTMFGGGFSFTHDMLPELDDNIWRHFNWNFSNRSLLPGPIKWTEDLDGRNMARAVGGQARSRRTEIIATLDPVNKQFS